MINKIKILTVFNFLILALALNAQALFEVKDSNDNTVLEVASDGLRIFNMGDTLMVISSSEIKAFIDENSKDRALSRSFSITTSTSAEKSVGKMFEIGASNGAIFYNPNDNSDQILSINKNNITANVNPFLDRDFIIDDQVSSKGSGNLMKISNRDAFEIVNDSTMLWYKDKNAFRVGHVLITNPDQVGQASFGAGSQTNASGDFSTALGKNCEASGFATLASGNGSFAIGYVSTAAGDGCVASGAASIAMGSLAETNSDYAVALGSEVYANGAYSLAAGNLCVSSGFKSIAMGSNNFASGDYSLALGNNSTASTYGSSALGTFCSATGYFSTALGLNTTAQPYCSFVIGRYNKIGGTTSSWEDDEALFIIGNGSGSTARSNALKVDKNGDVFIDALYNTTTSNTRKLLYVDSIGKLCVASKKEIQSSEEIQELIDENIKLNKILVILEERIKRLEESTSK